MRTFAQALLDIVGKSKLAERFQANPLFDPHSFLVAEYLNISYEEVLERKSQGDKNIKQMRQMMKAANFGFMGGASARNFGAFARDRYGVMDINSKKANELYNFYMRVFPEVDSYFSWITSQLNSSVDDEMTVILPRSGRIAGKKRYTQVCNCFAQGVAADGALKALYEITKESFDVNAILSRCRPILFIHDEIIVETPIDKADIVAKEIKRVMEKSMEHFTPNVPSIVSIAMADRWYKDAEAKYDSNGKLISWTPNSSKQNP
jgi:DNA polymerase-1